MSDDFYVYLHRKKTDGSVFYVGKGRGRRAFRTDESSRTQKWLNVAKKHGVEVEIVFEGLSEDEAYDLEVQTLLEMRYFNEPLVNHRQGGKGGCPTVFTEDIKTRISNSVREYYKDRPGPNTGAAGFKFWSNGRSDQKAWLNLDKFWPYYENLGISDRGLSRVFPEITRTTFKTVIKFFEINGNPSNYSEWLSHKNNHEHLSITERPFLCKPKYQCEEVFKNIAEVDRLVKAGYRQKYLAKKFGGKSGTYNSIINSILSGWNYRTDKHVCFMFERNSILAKVEYLEEDDND